MKAGREHRVPLSDRALAVLDEARQLADSTSLVFPSATGRMPSQTGLRKMLCKLGIDAVPHGFRSASGTGLPSAPRRPARSASWPWRTVNSDRVEAAYRRSDLFERRRTLMQEWADYLAATA